MPGLIGVGEFLDESREDYNSPTTSSFVSRMPQCRQTITSLEEVSSQLKKHTHSHTNQNEVTARVFYCVPITFAHM